MITDSATPRDPAKSTGAWVARNFVLPAAIGAVTGALVACLQWFAEDFAQAGFAGLSGYWPMFAPFAALPLSVLVMRYVTRTFTPSTNELYIIAYNTVGYDLPLRELPGRYLAGMATVSFGGSQGLESPSAFLGASLGALMPRWFQKLFSAQNKDVLMAAGAGAGIAAVFSSPGVGALYGMEVPFRSDVEGRIIVPAFVAAGSSFGLHALIVGSEPLVPATRGANFDGVTIAGVLVTAVACGFGARLFAWAQRHLRAFGTRIGRWTRALATGVGLVGLAAAGFAVAGDWVTFGAGRIALEWAFEAEQGAGVIVAVLLLHSIGTLACVFGGGGGGIFTSMAAAGALIGEAIAIAVDRPTGNIMPLIGAGALLGSGYRIPLAGALLIAESSGSFGYLTLGLIGVGIATLVMGDRTVAPAQVEHRDDRIRST